MQNKLRQTRQNIIILILNIVIAVMCVLMVLFGYTAVTSLYDAFSMPYTEDGMSYRVEDGNFQWMVQGYHVNTQAGFEGSSAMQEYYGVAKYYEAASFYRAFLEAGDMERAEREKAKMEEALVQMGSWSILEQEIREILGLQTGS